MWKLTIKQTVKRRYENAEFDHSEEVVFKSDRIENLAVMVTALSGLESVQDTEYKIEREVEKKC